MCGHYKLLVLAQKRQLLVVWEKRSILKLHWDLYVFLHQFVDKVTTAGNLFKILLLREYRLPSSCIRLTFDYNLFFIYIVEQDTFNEVILKNIHIITDKYNCSQIQAIIQLFDKVVRHTLALWCFANWCFGRLWRVEKEKSEIKQTWKLNVKILLR